MYVCLQVLQPALPTDAMLCPAARGRLYTIVHDLVGTCRTVLHPAHQHTTPPLLPAAGSSQSSLVHDLRGHVQGLHPLGSAAGGAGDLSHCPALQAEPAATLCRWGLLLPVCINARVSVRDGLSALPHRLCCSSSRRTFESAACSAGLAVHSEDPDLVHIAAVALVCFKVSCCAALLAPNGALSLSSQVNLLPQPWTDLPK